MCCNAGASRGGVLEVGDFLGDFPDPQVVVMTCIARGDGDILIPMVPGCGRNGLCPAAANGSYNSVPHCCSLNKARRSWALRPTTVAGRWDRLETKSESSFGLLLGTTRPGLQGAEPAAMQGSQEPGKVSCVPSRHSPCRRKPVVPGMAPRLILSLFL
jgi:hypothetical protein